MARRRRSRSRRFGRRVRRFGRRLRTRARAAFARGGASARATRARRRGVRPFSRRARAQARRPARARPAPTRRARPTRRRAARPALGVSRTQPVPTTRAAPAVFRPAAEKAAKQQAARRAEQKAIVAERAAARRRGFAVGVAQIEAQRRLPLRQRAARFVRGEAFPSFLPVAVAERPEGGFTPAQRERFERVLPKGGVVVTRDPTVIRDIDFRPQRAELSGVVARGPAATRPTFIQREFFESPTPRLSLLRRGTARQRLFAGTSIGFETAIYAVGTGLGRPVVRATPLAVTAERGVLRTAQRQPGTFTRLRTGLRGVGEGIRARGVLAAETEPIGARAQIGQVRIGLRGTRPGFIRRRVPFQQVIEAQQVAVRGEGGVTAGALRPIRVTRIGRLGRAVRQRLPSQQAFESVTRPTREGGFLTRTVSAGVDEGFAVTRGPRGTRITPFTQQQRVGVTRGQLVSEIATPRETIRTFRIGRGTFLTEPRPTPTAAQVTARVPTRTGAITQTLQQQGQSVIQPARALARQVLQREAIRGQRALFFRSAVTPAVAGAVAPAVTARPQITAPATAEAVAVTQRTAERVLPAQLSQQVSETAAATATRAATRTAAATRQATGQPVTPAEITVTETRPIVPPIGPGAAPVPPPVIVPPILPPFVPPAGGFTPTRFVEGFAGFQTRFQPSLVAIERGIFAEEPPRLLTGVGVRPVIGRRPKRKKKKKKQS